MVARTTPAHSMRPRQAKRLNIHELVHETTKIQHFFWKDYLLGVKSGKTSSLEKSHLLHPKRCVRFPQKFYPAYFFLALWFECGSYSKMRNWKQSNVNSWSLNILRCRRLYQRPFQELRKPLKSIRAFTFFKISPDTSM